MSARKYGHVSTVPLEEQHTAKAKWYHDSLHVIGKVRERRLGSRIILHHDNAAKVEVMTHPRHSPDLHVDHATSFYSRNLRIR